ncbi:MAG: hypothetical protein KDB07_07245, partial [Planctomycetes bacterium]|nr:hypothetical protein [Planctomycetota bacterium]
MNQSDAQAKRIVVVIGHAAHVQLFQHLIPLWQDRGWKVLVLARAKSLVRELLDARGIDYRVVSKPGGAFGMVGELARWWLGGLATLLRFRPQMVLSVGGTFSAFPAFFARARSVMLTDTEDATLGNKLALPF